MLALSRAKVHQLRYFPSTETGDITSDILALSTEDGRVLFYTTHSIGTLKDKQPEREQMIPSCAALGQLGGPATGVKGRIKDFEILRLPSLKGRAESTLIVTGSSDGALRLWTLNPEELNSGRPKLNAESSSNTGASTPQVGHLIGSYETGNRITCLKAFVMSRPSAVDGLVQIDGGDIDTGKTEDNSDEGRSS